MFSYVILKNDVINVHKNKTMTFANLFGLRLKIFIQFHISNENTLRYKDQKSSSYNNTI